LEKKTNEIRESNSEGTRIWGGEKKASLERGPFGQLVGEGEGRGTTTAHHAWDKVTGGARGGYGKNLGSRELGWTRRC